MIKKYNYFLRESANNELPQLKFPTDKAAHFNYIYKIIKKAGLKPNCLFKKEKNRDVSFQDFCFEKCNSPILFPKNREINIDKELGIRYKNFIFQDSVFLLPASYDSKNDYADYLEKKISFKVRMIEILKSSGASKKQIEDFEKNSDTHVDFGPVDYSKVNDALAVVYNEFKDYYVEDKLRVYTPEDMDDDGYMNYDYPHKYIYSGKYTRPNGIIFLSDLEKWLDNKYGLKDDMFYQYIIYNEYVEGRYWERVWSLSVQDKDYTKLDRTGMGKYGMKPTKIISQMLDIIEDNFEIEGNPYEGFPIFVDYYKYIKPKY